MQAKTWKDLSRQEFIELNNLMNGKDIANAFNVTPGAVYYRQRLFGLLASRKRRFDPPADELRALYESMSMADIAKHYGVGETVVFMRLKDHGIGGIGRSERLSGKPKSIEHRLAMSRAQREKGSHSGERNGNWKGGSSTENLRGRSKAAYFEWKSAVLAKAQWKCQGCGKEHGHVCECCGHRILLQAHHLVAFSVDHSLRYEPSNGKALCERCHWLEHHKQLGEFGGTPNVKTRAIPSEDAEGKGSA